MKIYQVGGSVRDQLLGKVINDRDWLVVGASFEEMLKLGFKPVGKDFPVFLHPQTHEEYALARTERKSSNKRGHGDFVFYYAPEVTVQEDLSRRDLTINAIAIDEEGLIIDPFNGREDIKNKIFRHISPAFSEDPLRILRVARFCAQMPQFTVADETIILMTQMTANDDLAHLSSERIWQELSRGLSEENPRKMFELLDKIGALEKIIPELTALKNLPQIKECHSEQNIFEHSLLVLDTITILTKSPEIRFAALCHNLGKAQTAIEFLPKNNEYETRGVAIIENICARLKTATQYTQLAKISCRWHKIVFDLSKSPKDENLWWDLLSGIDLWRRPEQFRALMFVVNAIYQGRYGFSGKNFEFIKTVEMLANEVTKEFSSVEKPTDKISREKIIRERIKKTLNLFPNKCEKF